jgi:hypothetical protein
MFLIGIYEAVISRVCVQFKSGFILRNVFPHFGFDVLDFRLFFQEPSMYGRLFARNGKCKVVVALNYYLTRVGVESCT